MTAALIIFAALFIFLAFTRLDWAVLLLIIALPSYLIRFTVFGVPATVLELMILIAFAVWFSKYFWPSLRGRLKARREKNSAWTPYPFSWEIILLVIIALSAALVAGFNPSALGIWKAYFFEPALVFILLFNVLKTDKGNRKIIGALAISAALVAAFAIFQKISGLAINNPFWADEGTRRVVSFFGYPNAVGLYLTPLIMILFGRLIADVKEKNYRNLTSLLYALAIITSLAAIWFAHSEGALIGLAAGGAVFGLLASRRSRIITLAGGVIVLAAIFAYAPIRSLAIEKITLSDLSGEIRQQQWKETLTMLSDGRIITGAGLNNYPASITPYHQEGIFFNRDHIANFDSLAYGSAELRKKYWQPTEVYQYPHNIFLNFWSEIGLIGALLFVWIFIKALALALKDSLATGPADRFIRLGLFGALTAIAVHGLVDVPYFKNDLAVMFWIILALIGRYSLSGRIIKAQAASTK